VSDTKINSADPAAAAEDAATASSYVPVTVTISPCWAWIRATTPSATSAETKIRHGRSSSRATKASASPWLPSLAATSVTRGSRPRSAASPAVGDQSAGSRSRRASTTAQVVPTTLNDGSPQRSVSSFAVTWATPHSLASRGSDTSGVCR
jgi:hypothetical protein